MHNMKKISVLAFAFLLFGAGQALAVLRIDVTQGHVSPMPIAIADFLGAEDYADHGRAIAQVIRDDLEHSGLFRSLARDAFIQKDASVNILPRFADWQLLNAHALVVGRVHAASGGRLRVDFRLWDITAREQMVGLQFITPTGNWRRIGHLIADAIYQRLTGETGYFDTRIVYVAESGPKNARIKRLAIMDQDGFNQKYLTSGENLTLTPRFSPVSQEVTYLSYYGGAPRVFLLNIETGEQEIVGDFPGMTFAPRFSPDGRKIIMSLEHMGHSNIYTLDLRTREVRRLTRARAIDTAPCYSPDGKQVIFESDRMGSQQLFVMNGDGSDLKRISFGKGHYATPVWSPRGDLIAFTKTYKGRFLIGVMKPDGSGERILTEGYHNEAPSWSPNGRVIAFFRENEGADGGPSLWTVDVTGYNERRMRIRGWGSDPAWSPAIED